MKERGKSRPDMTAGCEEKFDWEFIHWILRFNRDVVPQLEKTLCDYPNATIVRLRNRRQVKVWMSRLNNS
ncbi:MAG: hypothetical protein MZU97_16330 [Bacillus subtilis]|nr:hypothetical protein [Bacillus subtilis]